MATYKDTEQPAGSRVLTINSVTYKCNSFTRSETDSVTNLTDENGEHSGAIAVGQPETVTAEIQIATATTPIPTTASVATTTGTFVIGTATYFITSVSEARPSSGVWAVTINAQKRKNSV